LAARLTKLQNKHPIPEFGLCLAGNIPEVKLPGHRLVEAGQQLVAKLKMATGASLKDGVMSLLVSEHVYHKCLWCDQTTSFNLSDPPSGVAIPQAYIEVTNQNEFMKWAKTRWSAPSMAAFPAYRSFIGVCKRCNYTCADCNSKGPAQFSLEYMLSLKDDRICPECGKKLLANVKAPIPGRRELAALHRKSFLDL
jgi:DNA-directed RNA polymerase subunit RPC12/RpoP